MTDLAEFLLARIAEDERAILDYWDSDGKARVASMWTGGEPGYVTVAMDHADDHWVAAGRPVENPRHVRVLFDPARVLVECEAKRRFVQTWVATSRPPTRRAAGLETAARLLAATYADHPDYDDEWRP